jgi:DNA polymerase-3 subunit alpha
MPDIDIDFDGERRREVIEYIRQKYGADSVCQIVTFGKMKAKMAIRDIGRVLEIPLAYVNKLAKMIPEGPKVDLQEEINSNKELQHEIKQQPETKKLFQLAQKLEGTVRNTSMHAAGVVIAPKKLTEFMPLYKAKDDIVTQFEKDEVEEVGLLKMDILGLKTLTILKNILKEIKDVEGLDLDLDQIPINDPKTFQVFQSGDTDGIFQFESSGMRDYLKRSKPDKIEDLIVLNALYRPGPLGSGMADSYVNRKIGKEAVTYLFPEIQDILKDTYGIIVFQEQVMQISVVVAGFSMSKADEMRKIMGKKQVNKLPAIEKQFTAGAKDRNFDTKKANELFSQMKTFAEYGFNKSHSTAYAFLAYQTAYLKAHYPVYFMAANLSNEAEKTSSASQVIQYISEIKKMGIQLLPPDINHSFEYFKVETASAIRFGLKGLKNVGDAAIQAIISSRNENGPFKDYADFISRIDLTKVNKAVLESLIKAGLFDKFGIKRRALFLSVEAVIKQAAVLEKKKQDLQMSLFGNDNIMSKVTIPKDLQDEPEWSETEIIKGEREITGIYISHNPLENYQEEIKKVSNTQIANLSSFKNGKVKIAGIVTDFKQIKSKKGDFYGDIYFEDFSGRVKVLAFKDRWEKVKDTITVDKLYFLEGRIPEQAESDPNIYLENLIDLDAHLLSSARKIIVKIDHTLLNQDFNLQLAEKIKANQDSVPYVIVIRQNGYRAIIASTDDHAGLKPTTEMKTAIESLTGANTVEILYS